MFTCKKFICDTSARAVLLLASALFLQVSFAQEPGIAKPQVVINEVISGMPTSEKQAIRVLTANLKPGDKTPSHTHRFPVTLYILEGAFTLEMEGRDPITVKAGQSFVEPPNVKMTGYNHSADADLKIVIFYVSDLNTPFLDPVTK